MTVFLGIDIGKTNIRIGVFDGGMKPVERWSTSAADVPAAQDALRNHLLHLQQTHTVTSAGVSIFGPLQVNPEKDDYGAVIESSEPAWSNVNIPALVSSTLGQAVHFDYDVNAGALAEATLGAGRGTRSFVYLSVGTGIGGALFRGGIVPGHAPQFGHMYLPRETDDLAFAGSCRFHGGCLQGMASGKAIAARWNTPGEHLPAHHPAWDLEARYLARACANLVYTFSPENIVLGSSIASVPNLVESINTHLHPLLNNFIEPELRTLYAARGIVTRAALTPDSSLIGAALLGRHPTGLHLRVPRPQK